MSDVFLSYAAEDIENARGIALQVEASGWSVFFDRRIPVGKTWDDVVETELERARCVVVLWSRHSIGSAWVRAEAEDAAARGILIPVLLEEVKIPLRFRTLQAAHWATGADFSARRDQLLDAIARIVGTPSGLRPERGSEPRRDNLWSSSRQVSPDFSVASLVPSGNPQSLSLPIARPLDEAEIAAAEVAVVDVEAQPVPEISVPDTRLSPRTRSGTVIDAAAQGLSASDDENGRPAITRLRAGAVCIGTALTLSMWAVAFQAYYPSDFLIKYNYLLAVGTLLAGLALVRGVIFATAIPLVVTWSILGSAITLTVAASLFRLYYPNDNLIVRNYFLSAVEVVVWLLLAKIWEAAVEPPRSARRLNHEVSHRLTRTGPDGAA